MVDLGHVTFGSVSDWSEEQEQTLEQNVDTYTLEQDEDDGQYTLMHQVLNFCLLWVHGLL